MEAWFLSDIHLKSMEERNGKILLRFLHSLLQKEPSQVQLFLLGDIFDLWIGGHQYFIESYRPLVDALKMLRDAGVRIVYFEGNHDVHIESFFRDELGCEVFVEAKYFELDEMVVRCEHGDQINLNDSKYLRYRGIIRGEFVRSLAINLPGWFWNFIGNRMSRASRKRSSVYRAQNEEQLVKMVRDHSERAYKEKKFDYIISGHMHVYDDYTWESHGHKIRSLNLGSWFENNVKVYLIKNGMGEWVTLPSDE